MNCLRVINPWEQRTGRLSHGDWRQIAFAGVVLKVAHLAIHVLSRRGISGHFVPLPLKLEICTSPTCSSLSSIGNFKLTPLKPVNFRDPVMHSRANPKPRLAETTIRQVGASALDNRGRLIFYLRESINLDVLIEFRWTLVKLRDRNIRYERIFREKISYSDIESKDYLISTVGTF